MISEFDPDVFAQSVLYEDNHLLAVLKPAGLLVQADRTGREALLDQAKAFLKARDDKPGRVYLGLVHRLDRPVAGVVLLARTSKAAGRLAAQFRARQIEKTYLAVVQGRPAPPEGFSRVYLVREGRRSVLAGPNRPRARRAELSYRTLETGREASLVEVKLVTGRRHQIRAQLSALGHPVLGDREYGSTHPPRQDSIGLFARALTIRHPTTGQAITLVAEPPPDWPWLPLK